MNNESIATDSDETRLEGVLRVFLDFNHEKYKLQSLNTSDYQLVDSTGRAVPLETNIMKLTEGQSLQLTYKPVGQSKIILTTAATVRCPECREFIAHLSVGTYDQPMKCPKCGKVWKMEELFHPTPEERRKGETPKRYRTKRK
jgi:phage FluMu protein Com